MTVAAVDDTVDDDGESVTLVHTASGGGYDDLAESLTVTITDDDDPAVTVSFEQGSYSVAEGSEVTVTVELSAEPERQVVVPLTHTAQGDTTAADYSVTPTSVTFEAGDTSKTFTFTAASDDIDDDGESVRLGFGTALPERVTAGTTATATVTIGDDDTAGVSVVPAAVSVTEGGASASHTVRLATEPTADVTVTITGTGTDVTLDVSSLTFTADTWDTAQAVTVTAIDDDLAEGAESVTLTHTAAGGGYDNVAASLRVDVVDDDAAGVVAPTLVSVTEGEAGVGYGVRLATEPTADVTVTVSGAGTDVTLSATSLTFTADTWDTAQEVTVTAIDDDLAEGSESVTLTHTAAGGGYDNVAASLTVSITDNDAAGVVVPAAVTVTEGEAGVGYGVRLATEPTANVTVTITGITGDVRLDTTSMTFTAGDWDTAQTVTVAAVDDTVDDDGESVTLVHTASGGGYDDLAASLTVTITDNDDPRVTVSFEQGSYSVAEGSSVEVTVVLSAAPERQVVVPITHVGRDGATAADYSGVPSSVTFEAGDTSKTFTFTAASDDIDDDGDSVALGFGTPLPERVTAGTTATATVTIGDDDVAGLTLSPVSVSVTEGGAASSYTVVLDSQPTADVTVTITGTGTDVTLDVSSLTFTADTWDTAQAVTVTAIDDDLAEGAESVTLTHTAAGGGYDNVAASLRVDVVDDDAAGVVAPTLVSVTEGEAGVGYGVRLATEPTADVTVTVSGAGTDVTLSATSLTFTADTWDTAQEVTVTAIDDDLDEETESVTLTHTAASADSDYDNLAASLTVSITDNDAAGVVVPAAVTVTEGEAGVGYGVRLATEPTANVTVTVTGATGDVTLDTTSMTFTADTGTRADGDGRRGRRHRRRRRRDGDAGPHRVGRRL